MHRPPTDLFSVVQRRALLLAGAASVVLPLRKAGAQATSVLNIATTGDPGPLDPTPVTSDLLSEITQLFYETLYIFGRISPFHRCLPPRCRRSPTAARDIR